jgi:uncharacterized membrane protein
MSPDIAPSRLPPGEGAAARDSAPISPGSGIKWRPLLSFSACVVYPFLVYWVLSQRQAWPGLLLTGAALLGLCLCLPGWRARILAIIAVAALAGAAVALATPSSLLFLPPLAVNLGLAWFFGRTLPPGREALITRFARLGQDELDPAVVAYTRRLTWVWVAFFLLMAAVSASLAGFGAHWAWAWFTAVGNYLCVAALFAIEYAYRRRRFPRHGQPSPRDQLMMVRDALRDSRR